MSYQSVQDDGYSQPFYIKGIPGLFHDVRGTVRPMQHHERYIVAKKLGEVSGQKQSEIMVTAICKHVTEWTLKGPDGESLPFSYPHARHIKNPLIERLYYIVLAVDAGDEDPERPWTHSEAASEYEALMEGADLGLKREENDAKN